MLLLPASVAEVVEAGEVPGQKIRQGEGFEENLVHIKSIVICIGPAKVWTLLHAAQRAQGVLEVGNINFFSDLIS